MTLWAIEDVVPHRGSMLLVDRLLHADDDCARVEIALRPDSMFMQEGAVPCYIGLEYMAQAVAAWAGVRARVRNGPPPSGYLLGTRRYDASVPSYPAGAVLQAEARVELIHDNGMAVFNCTVQQGENVWARAQIMVYQAKHGELPPSG